MRHRVLLPVCSGRILDVRYLVRPVLFIGAILILQQSAIRAANFLPTTTPSVWIEDTNWDTNSTPNAVGASATFGTTSPTAYQTVTLASDVTIGSLTYNTPGATAFATTIGNADATGGRLILDAAGAGPAVITAAGTSSFGTSGSNTNAIAATMVFQDDVVIDVQNPNGITGGTTQVGAFRLGGPVSGPGGLTKTGPGLMTWAFTPSQTGLNKDYQGATVLSGGRVRMSSGAAPRLTPSFTINGGQLTPISANGIYTLGASSATPLNLNGFGPTTGAFAAFPGLIRPDTGLSITITNNTVLQSDSMLHMQSTVAGAGTLTMSGNMSGNGILYAGGNIHDANGGVIRLQGTNSYTGGTVVNVGTLDAFGISTTAFGSGSVQVVSANAVFGGSQAHVHIASGATNAIADSAYLNLAGGKTPGVADDGYIDLDSGITETVGGLMLGGTIMPAGTYGATGSGATNINDEYFFGGGMINNAATGVPGDYNGNGVVDAADEVLWRKGGSLANDFTPGVQASDYDFWRTRFTATTNPGSGSGLGTTAVPEPSTIALVGCLITLAATRRHRKSVHVSHREAISSFNI